MLSDKERKDVNFWHKFKEADRLTFFFLCISVTFCYYQKYKKDPKANARLRLITNIFLATIPVSLTASHFRAKTFQ